MRNGMFYGFLVIMTVGSGCVIDGDGGWLSGRKEFKRIVELSDPIAGAQVFSAETEGDITVRGTDTDECQVKAIVQAWSFTTEQAKTLAEATTVLLVREGPVLKLRINKPETQSREYIGVLLDGIIPRTVAAELHTRTGNVRIANLDVAAVGHTYSNSVVQTGMQGNVKVSTNIGKVVIRNVKAGQIDLKTGSGSIDGEKLSGNLKASTDVGDVRLREVTAKRMELKTCSGSIEGKVQVESLQGSTNVGDIEVSCLRGSNTKDIQLSTHSGSIRLAVPQDYSAQVEVSTYSGTIHTDFPMIMKGTVNKSGSGIIGGGEGRLDLQTTNGSITLIDL